MRTDGGGNFYTNPPPLWILSSSLSRSLSFSSLYLPFLPSSSLYFVHPSSSGFSRGVEEFFELTPTCSTAFLSVSYKGSKMAL